MLPALAGARSYGPFMREVNQITDGDQVYLYPNSIYANTVIFYRGSAVPTVEGSPQDVARYLWTSGDYFIMGECPRITEKIFKQPQKIGAREHL